LTHSSLSLHDALPISANVYSGPAEQLGLLAVQGDAEVPHLTRQRGLPLAEAIDTALRETALGRRLSAGELPDRVPSEVLRELGRSEEHTSELQSLTNL